MMHLNKRDFLEHIKVLGNMPFEMSAFKPKTKEYEVPYNGVFDSQEAAWNEANRLNKQGFGIYLSLNPAEYEVVHNNLEQYRKRNKAPDMMLNAGDIADITSGMVIQPWALNPGQPR